MTNNSEPPKRKGRPKQPVPKDHYIDNQRFSQEVYEYVKLIKKMGHATTDYPIGTTTISIQDLTEGDMFNGEIDIGSLLIFGGEKRKKPKYKVAEVCFTKDGKIDELVLSPALEAPIEKGQLVTLIMTNPERTPTVPNYIADCFLRMSKGMAIRPNFRGYTYIEDMMMDGVQYCLLGLKSYKIDAETKSGYPNAFGYFSMIMHNAFVQRILKEKKEVHKKDRFVQLAGIDDYVSFDKNCESDNITVQNTIDVLKNQSVKTII